MSEKGGGQGREYPGSRRQKLGLGGEASTCCLAPKEVIQDNYCMQHSRGQKPNKLQLLQVYLIRYEQSEHTHEGSCHLFLKKVIQNNLQDSLQM